ncbi:sulfatase family protein [Aestuariibaculum sediminum]|uniref:Sulfatase n=1 Tax=Aestuariibaculum sediminum TaxID=2770637 RepID=A0A8J6Q8J7_9FLAO|nr:sulfatase [Aestuariibaculum sediminum]MBD0831642.1 sulfatase [Aestuariibaculum sediminum]
MKSSVFLKLSLVFILFGGICACQSDSKKISKQKPNLLFIFPDQLRNAAIGINKQDPVYTPNIDKLAKEGMVITNAISNYPLCSPYRGMLMTGKLPYNNSVLSNSNSRRYKYNNSWQKEDVSFSDVLVQNGYDAGYVGKLHLTSPAPIAGKDSVIWDAYTPKEFRHGFNFWYSYGTFDVHNTPHYWLNDAKEDELTHVDEWSPKHEADVIINYLKNPSEKTRNKDKPFALFWSVNPPHPPYQYVPEEYAKIYEERSLEELLVRENVNLQTQADDLAFHKGATRNRTHLAKDHVKDYFAMITGVDEQIGRVLQTLKEEGLEKNTIVVITSDHGEMMGSHGLMSKNIWYEESINIPFIIRWPERIKSHQTSDLIVSATDVMPTLLNLLRATDGFPKDLDGEDLSALFLGKNEEEPTSALYYYIEEGKPESGHRGIRTKRYTYVITFDNQDLERKVLFDNVEDPFQKNNIAGNNLEIESELHQKLLAQLKSKNDPWLKRYLKLTDTEK